MTYDEKRKQISAEYDPVINMLLMGVNSLVNYISISGRNNAIATSDFELHICLTLLDLQAGMKHLKISTTVGNQFEANYFARILSLNCYELMNGVNEKMAIELKKLQKSEEKPFLNKIINKRKELGQLKRIHGDYLKEIRVNIIAHRKDKSGIEQNKQMLELDVYKIDLIASSVSEIYVSIMEFLFSIRSLS